MDRPIEKKKGIALIFSKKALPYWFGGIMAAFIISLIFRDDASTLRVNGESLSISEVSFYRNFESKKDVLEKHLVILLEEWGKEFEALGDPSKFSDSLIRHYYKHKDIYLILYKQGLSDMIYETIRGAMKLHEAQHNLERYAKSMIAGMIWGWLDEWMRQGMPEDPDEIALLSAQMNQNNSQ